MLQKWRMQIEWICTIILHFATFAAMRALLLAGAAIGACTATVHVTDSANLLENPSFSEAGEGPRSPARGWVGNVTQFRRVEDATGGFVLRFDGAAAGVCHVTACQSTLHHAFPRMATVLLCWARALARALGCR